MVHFLLPNTSSVQACCCFDSGLGRRQLPLIWIDFGCRAAPLGPFWEYVAFVANSLIFLLIGAQEAQQHFKGLWVPVLLAIALVTLGRAATIYPLCALFARSRLKVICGISTSFSGRAAGRFGARPVVIPPRGPCAARSHRSDYFCRRGLLCVRARTDDYPALTPPGPPGQGWLTGLLTMVARKHNGCLPTILHADRCTHYAKEAKLATIAGARTSLFVPAVDRYF